MSSHCPVRLCTALVLSLFALGVSAEETGVSQKPPVTAPTPVSSAPNNGLEGFDFNQSNGLYATITAFNSFEEPKLSGHTTIGLKHVKDFAKDFEVEACLQNGAAPLVVIQLGLGAHANSKLAKLWMRYLHDAGCHVVAMDSTFIPRFNDCSRHGVIGNIEAEALMLANVIDAIKQSSALNGKVTKLGLIGCSYGSVVCLNLAKLAQDGKTPVKPDRVLAFSPPVRMQTAAGLLDSFWVEDRWNYTEVDLYNALADRKPQSDGTGIPVSDSMMRAGLAASFRIDLKEVVEYCDRQYKLGMLPRGDEGDEEYRRDKAGQYTFSQFMNEMTYPYWAAHGQASSPQDIWAHGDLRVLLEHCPPGVRVFIAQDDPINESSELQQLREALDKQACNVLTVLPRGGHMGYVGCNWHKRVVQEMFGDK